MKGFFHALPLGKRNDNHRVMILPGYHQFSSIRLDLIEMGGKIVTKVGERYLSHRLPFQFNSMYIHLYI